MSTPLKYRPMKRLVIMRLNLLLKSMILSIVPLFLPITLTKNLMATLIITILIDPSMSMSLITVKIMKLITLLIIDSMISKTLSQFTSTNVLYIAHLILLMLAHTAMRMILMPITVSTTQPHTSTPTITTRMNTSLPLSMLMPIVKTTRLITLLTTDSMTSTMLSLFTTMSMPFIVPSILLMLAHTSTKSHDTTQDTRIASTEESMVTQSMIQLLTSIPIATLMST